MPTKTWTKPYPRAVWEAFQTDLDEHMAVYGAALQAVCRSEGATRAYDPDENRDEHGRWSGDGGSPGPGDPQTTPAATIGVFWNGARVTQYKTDGSVWRHGTVVRVRPPSGNVYIQWDGRENLIVHDSDEVASGRIRLQEGQTPPPGLTPRPTPAPRPPTVITPPTITPLPLTVPDGAPIRAAIAKNREEVLHLQFLRNQAEDAVVHFNHDPLLKGVIGKSPEEFTPEERAAVDRLNAAIAAMDVAAGKARAAQNAETSRALKLLAEPHPAKLTMADVGLSNRSAIMQNITAGLASMNAAMPYARWLTSDSVPARIAFATTTRGRAYFDMGAGTVRLGSEGWSSGPETVIHETGHWMEAMDPSVHDRALAFLARRTQGQAWITMNKATGSTSYGPEERTIPDKFISAYVGKNYGGHATEVVSVGLETMLTNPVTFASADPEHFDLIYGILKTGMPFGRKPG